MYEPLCRAPILLSNIFSVYLRFKIFINAVLFQTSLFFNFLFQKNMVLWPWVFLFPCPCKQWYPFGTELETDSRGSMACTSCVFSPSLYGQHSFINKCLSLFILLSTVQYNTLLHHLLSNIIIKILIDLTDNSAR